MEIKASYYIKACKRIKEMLRTFPSLKKTLTLEDRKKLTVDLARHLQAEAELRREQEVENQNICTLTEYCRHCIYGQTLIGKQVACKATSRMISARHRGKCENYKEGYISY